MTPQEVLDSTSPQIRKLLAEVIKIEQEYQHYKNLSSVKTKEREVCDRIVKLLSHDVES